MQRPGADLSQFADAINSATARFSMNTRPRVLAFLAQVRHETAGLTSFHQPADNGAGSLHMIPANWGEACNGVSDIKDAFNKRFPNCANCECTVAMASDPFGADATAAAVDIFGQPNLAILSGTWWFAFGAGIQSIFGWKGCTDLRLDADAGMGGPGASDCKHTGFYQITCCVFYTITGSAGLPQRITYYKLADSVLPPGGSASATSDNSTNFQQGGAQEQPGLNPIYVGLIVGASVIVLATVIGAVIFFLKVSPVREEIA